MPTDFMSSKPIMELVVLFRIASASPYQCISVNALIPLSWNHFTDPRQGNPPACMDEPHCTKGVAAARWPKIRTDRGNLRAGGVGNRESVCTQTIVANLCSGIRSCWHCNTVLHYSSRQRCIFGTEPLYNATFDVSALST
jgi:hypothetical protein